jgi:hypothetical protein
VVCLLSPQGKGKGRMTCIFALGKGMLEEEGKGRKVEKIRIQSNITTHTDLIQMINTIELKICRSNVRKII